MTKIAKLTARYLADHPVIRDCLSRDMINYSKLARQISRELNIKKVNAVTAACRRYAARLRKTKEETGIDLLKKSKKAIKISDHKAQITFEMNEKYLSRVLEALR